MLKLSNQDLVQEILKVRRQVDLLSSQLRQDVVKIDRKYSPRAEFCSWAKSEDGRNWKIQKYHQQQQCCAICERSIDLKWSHIDHIKPISKYPELHLDLNNLQVTCPDCNVRKSNNDK